MIDICELRTRTTKTIAKIFLNFPSVREEALCMKPRAEALQKLSMEPEIRAASAYDTQETRIIKGLEEITKELQQIK